MNRIIFLLFLVIFSSCNLPKDPENSFQEARENALLVGVVENPPFVETMEDSIRGTEVAKILEFAQKENLQVNFEKGNESELVHKLEKYDLHVVIGGIKKKTIWKHKAGLTKPYDKEHVFLIPKGENRLLEHLENYIYRNKHYGEH